jgi:hypothetical protein
MEMSFSQLKEVVAFLAVRLDGGDADAIADQCSDTAQDTGPHAGDLCRDAAGVPHAAPRGRGTLERNLDVLC